MHRNPKSLWLIAPFVVTLVLAFLAGGALLPLGKTAAPPQEAGTTAVARTPAIGVDRYGVADVVDQVSPAVVFIEVEYKQAPRSANRINPFDPWSFWFDAPQPGPRGGIGTGFIIDKEGHILTNQHVVDQADQIAEIRVTVEGHGEPYQAELVGSDVELDLAVLKIEPRKALPVAKLGDSDKARVGEWVVAIGNPYRFDHTVTVGVLSAKGRTISIPDENLRQERVYRNLMQTDAAINPGNSGGPLINLAGEVVGINTAVNAAAQGIGFAIPINKAKEVLDQLITRGKVIRPFIGIEYQPLTVELARYYGLQDRDGILIVNVIADTAAAKAGLRPGDVIREVNRKAVKTEEDFQKALEGMKVGDKLSLLVRRDGRLVVVDLQVGERPQGL